MANLGTLGKLAVDISANDKTKPGVQAAERTVGRLGSRGGVIAAAAAKGNAHWVRSNEQVARSLGAIDKVVGSSGRSGIIRSIASVGQAGSEAELGIIGAARAASLLAGTLGPVGIIAGAAAATIGSVAFATDKMVSGWAKGINGAKRLADTLGVSTQALQKFQAAGERAGVDPGASAGVITGLAGSLNDAAYGKNTGAILTMARAGITLKRQKNGDADVMAMIPDIANAFKRQTPSGARTLAAGLSIPFEAIPMLMQGGGPLTKDMLDAPAATPGMIDQATRWTRKRAIAGQVASSGYMAAGAVAEGAAEPALDGITNGERSFMHAAMGGGAGGIIARAMDSGAGKIERGGEKIERAAGWLSQSLVSAVQHAQGKYHIPSSVQLAQYADESAYGRHMPPGSNNPFGIKARPGEPFVEAWTTEHINGRNVRVRARFRKYESMDEAVEDHARLLARGRYNSAFREALPNVGRAVEELGHGTASDPRYATDPEYGKKLRRYIAKDDLARFDGIPVKLELTMRGAPPGTTAKVTSGKAVLISKTPVGRLP